MTLKQERNNDLLEAYNLVLKKLGRLASHMPREALILLTINSPAKKHYVSVEEAAKQINNIERRQGGLNKSQLRVAQYQEIYSSYLKLSNEMPYLCKSERVRIAVETPAPCFYLTLSGAIVLFWNLNKTTTR